MNLNPRMNCEQVEVLLGARLDGSLELQDRVSMDAHIAGCDECRSMLSDIERIVADARVLPAMMPSRDLWSDIQSQLGAQDTEVREVEVHSLAAAQASKLEVTRRAPSWRALAAAAVLLVAVTAGVTWNLARVNTSAGDVPQMATGTPPAVPPTGSDPAVGSDPYRGSERASEQAVATPMPDLPRMAEGNQPVIVRPVQDSFEVRRQQLAARYVANSAEEVDAIYEREIAALRTIVDERFTELDSTTVAELKKNLDIIDRAIVDSRAALRRDPRSRLLSRQLDRAIEHKMELLRRVALL